jgi:hypothetical protein
VRRHRPGRSERLCEHRRHAPCRPPVEGRRQLGLSEAEAKIEFPAPLRLPGVAVHAANVDETGRPVLRVLGLAGRWSADAVRARRLTPSA